MGAGALSSAAAAAAAVAHVASARPARCASSPASHSSAQVPVQPLAAPPPAPAATPARAPAGDAGIRSVVLYQYDSCPFCNRVRAYLDFARIPYTVVEVDPLFKSQIAWSRDYRKVPIAVINGERVVDSTAIIDYCEELLSRRGAGGGVHLAGVSPLGSGTPREAARRAWVDDHLVRLLTPNIYRTLPEAWQSFAYMTERNFSPAAALPAAVIGSGVMWALAGRLRRKHGIPAGGERAALCTALDEFVAAVDAGGSGSGSGGAPLFHGGASPDLADVAVFGTLRAVRGLDTETDMLAGSRIGPWLAGMRRELGARAGRWGETGDADGAAGTGAAALRGSALEHRVGEATAAVTGRARG